MLITYPEGRILSRSTISIPGNTLTPRRTTLRSLDKSRLNERPTTCRQAHAYMRIGDHLELLTEHKGDKVKAVHQAEVRALMVTHDRSILPYVDTIYELTHGTLTKVEA